METEHETPEESSDGSEYIDEPDDAREAAATAFVVVIDHEGTATALVDHEDLKKFRFDREPTLQDVWRGCAEVAKDVEAMEISARVMQQQMQMAQQVAQQREAQQIYQRTVGNQGKTGSGLHVPGS